MNIKVFVWGLNDKDQLGGLKGSKVKLPVFSDTLGHLKPICIAGGSKSLFIVTQVIITMNYYFTIMPKTVEIKSYFLGGSRLLLR